MSRSIGILLGCGLLACGAVEAGQGRLLATGGASQLEGSAGGGIVPWAVLAGYGTRDENGGTAFASRVDTDDYALTAFGAAWTFRNRLELSVARQRFDLGRLRRDLDLPWAALEQDIWGAKLRLGGDLVYGDLPQLSIGVQHKRLHDPALPLAVGARSGNGTDFYIVASRLFLDAAGGYPLLLNLGLRSSRSNQMGLLGFGGDQRRERSLLWEGSVAVLPSPRWAVGVEYRQKPDNLGFAREDDWMDGFVAWFPSKRVSLVAAWAELGDIATLPSQRGGYLSLQIAF